MASNQQTPDLHLDIYLDGIREKFNRLNRELDEARNQRDEYERNYMKQLKELQEFRQTSIIGNSEGRRVGQHCKSCGAFDDNLSPASSSSESYFSIHEEEPASDRPYPGQDEGGCGDNLWQNYTPNEISVNSSLALQSKVSPIAQPDNPDSTWNVEFNPDTKVALELNPVHIFTQNTTRTYAAFSMDGKYLATVSETGTVHIFDAMTGQRISVMRDLYKSGDDEVPPYWCLVFSPDGKFLATGQSDGYVKIWILSQRRVRNTFKHHGRVNVLGLDFSPNGKYICHRW